MSSVNRGVSVPTAAAVAVVLIAAGAAAGAVNAAQPAPVARVALPLIEKVRAATARYKDVNVAISEGWVPATPCVSGPDFGAMGVHYVLPGRLGDAVLDAQQPEALIYEPMAGGVARLVGVEFIVLEKLWAGQNPNGNPPALEGNLLNLVAAPNRFGLPAFYELHVWAWEDNPSGSYADWNLRVSCAQQPGP